MTHAFGSISAGPWQLVNVLSQPDGKVILENPDGTVVSIQPDGSIGSRPAGTTGPWEVARLDQGIVTYVVSNQAFPFALRQV